MTPRPISPGDVIGEVFRLYGRYAAVLLPVSVVVYAINSLANAYFDEGFLAIIGFVVSIVIGTFFTGMVVQLVRDVQDGRLDAGIGELVSSVGAVALPLFLVSLIAGLLTGLGFVLLIVPGVILAVIWSVIAPVAVIERPGVVQTLSRSQQLVRGNFWPVLGVIALGVLLAVVIGVVLALIAAPFGEVAALVVSFLWSAVTGPVVALTGAVLYFALLRAQGQTPTGDPTTPRVV